MDQHVSASEIFGLDCVVWLEKVFNDSRLASLDLLTHKFDLFLEHKALGLVVDPVFETTSVFQLRENVTKHVPKIFCWHCQVKDRRVVLGRKAV
jgi:hypothetical protein